MAELGFWSKKVRNVLKRMKNLFLRYGLSKFLESSEILFRLKRCAMFWNEFCTEFDGFANLLFLRYGRFCTKHQLWIGDLTNSEKCHVKGAPTSKPPIPPTGGSNPRVRMLLVWMPRFRLFYSVNYPCYFFLFWENKTFQTHFKTLQICCTVEIILTHLFPPLRSRN